MCIRDRVSRALRDGQALAAASEVVRAVLPSMAEPAAWGKTGAAIRAMREAAGLTIAEVGAAIDLKDPSLIEALENGRIALSFELILRLAAVFGRSDPIGFIMTFTRSSNPDLWKSLEALGVGTVSYTHLDVYKRQAQDRAHPTCSRPGLLGYALRANPTYDGNSVFSLARMPTRSR